MKKHFLFSALVILSLTFSINSAVASTAPVPGSKCTKVGSTRISNSLKFTCKKNGKKLTWSSGVSTKGKQVNKPTQISAPSDALNFKGQMIYGLKNGSLTRKADIGTYFETDSRKTGSFSAIRQKAFAELNANAGSTSHPNIEFIYNIRPSFPQALVEHTKRDLDEAAALWNDLFDSKISVVVYLVTEKDRDYIKSNNWLEQNLPAIFDRFDNKAERPFISGGGGYYETNGVWQGHLFLATASTVDLTYINYEWPQVAKHEFFHVVQDYSSYKSNRPRFGSRTAFNKFQPQHFREGGANAVSYLTAFKNIGWSNDAMSWLVWQRAADNRSWIDIKTVDDVLRMMIGTEQGEPYEAFESSYAIGAVMYEWVIGTYGRNGFSKLLRQLATANTFDEALQRSIGITQSELYAKSAPYVFSVFQEVR